MNNFLSLISIILIISCGGKKKQVTKKLSKSQQAQISQIVDSEKPPIPLPLAPEVKTFQEFFKKDFTLHNKSQLILKKDVKQGEQILVHLNNFFNEEPIIKETNESLNYCISQTESNYRIACSHIDLFKKMVAKNLKATIEYKPSLPKFRRLRRIFEKWSKQQFETPLYPEDLFIKFFLNGQEIEINSSEENENQMNWLLEMDTDGVFEIKFVPKIIEDNLTMGHASPRLYPCSFMYKVRERYPAYVTDQRLIDSNNFCNNRSYLLLSADTKSSQQDFYNRITGKIAALSKEP